MADILSQIEAFENNFLNNVASYLKAATGLEICLAGKPFIAPTTPYMTIRIIDGDDSGGWSSNFAFENEMMQTQMEAKFDVEVMAIHGRPTTLLMYVLATLRGNKELKYQYLYSKNIGFLSASNVSNANTVLDGDKTEQRARMFLTFNTTMVVEDLPTTEIAQVNIHIDSYKDSYEDPTPIEQDLDKIYIVARQNRTDYFTDDKSLISHIPLDNTIQ